MDKRIYGLAGAMREIAEERDDLLRDATRIPARRHEELNAFLAGELPVETALFNAARQRDTSLSLADPALPAAVNAKLIEQAQSARAATKPLYLVRQLAAWLDRASVPRAYRAAAVLAATALIASAALHFLRPGKAAVWTPREPRSLSFVNLSPAAFFNVSIFDRPADQRTLRTNRVELASLEPSLLTINRSLPDLERPDPALPLDLPTRKIRLDVEAVRMP